MYHQQERQRSHPASNHREGQDITNPNQFVEKQQSTQDHGVLSQGVNSTLCVTAIENPSRKPFDLLHHESISKPVVGVGESTNTVSFETQNLCDPCRIQLREYLTTPVSAISGANDPVMFRKLLELQITNDLLRGKNTMLYHEFHRQLDISTQLTSYVQRLEGELLKSGSAPEHLHQLKSSFEFPDPSTSVMQNGGHLNENTQEPMQELLSLEAWHQDKILDHENFIAKMCQKAEDLLSIGQRALSSSTDRINEIVGSDLSEFDTPTEDPMPLEQCPEPTHYIGEESDLNKLSFSSLLANDATSELPRAISIELQRRNSDITLAHIKLLAHQLELLDFSMSKRSELRPPKPQLNRSNKPSMTSPEGGFQPGSLISGMSGLSSTSMGLRSGLGLVLDLHKEDETCRQLDEEYILLAKCRELVQDLCSVSGLNSIVQSSLSSKMASGDVKGPINVSNTSLKDHYLSISALAHRPSVVQSSMGIKLTTESSLHSIQRNRFASGSLSPFNHPQESHSIQRIQGFSPSSNGIAKEGKVKSNDERADPVASLYSKLFKSPASSETSQEKPKASPDYNPLIIPFSQMATPSTLPQPISQYPQSSSNPYASPLAFSNSLQPSSISGPSPHSAGIKINSTMQPGQQSTRQAGHLVAGGRAVKIKRQNEFPVGDSPTSNLATSSSQDMSTASSRSIKVRSIPN
jgi:hypothetical protein